MWRTRRANDTPYQASQPEAGHAVAPSTGGQSPAPVLSPGGVASPSLPPTPLAGPVERIIRYNDGREPERLQLKFARMRGSIFAFFRGTSHLFYEDWPSGNALDRTPTVWTTGDLHLENFGSYKADNRLVYFDISDFDDAGLAPPVPS